VQTNGLAELAREPPPPSFAEWKLCFLQTSEK
jgi:hypothetical protein